MYPMKINKKELSVFRQIAPLVYDNEWLNSLLSDFNIRQIKKATSKKETAHPKLF